MKVRKSTAVLLLLSLVLSVICGCGSRGQEDADSNPVTAVWDGAGLCRKSVDIESGMDVGSICGDSGHEYLIGNRFDSEENDLYFEIRDGDENVLYSASYSKITGIDAVAAGDGYL